MKKIHIVSLTIACVIVLMGCKQSGKLEGLVSVSGVVFYEGNPVEGASVVFSPTDGGERQRAASGKTDASGRFVMMTLNFDDGVFPGEYAVTIRKKEHVGKYIEETLPGGAVRGHYDDPRVVDKLPIKYSDVKYSDLTVTIPPEGSKNIEFRLEGKVDLTAKDPKQERGGGRGR